MNSQDVSNFVQNPEVIALFADFHAEYAVTPKTQFNADQAKKQELEAQNAELIGQLKNMNMAMQELVAERDTLRNQHTAIQGERDFYFQADKQRAVSIRKLQDQHAKELTNKNLEYQALEDKLVASQEQHAKELNDKNLVIRDLETHLSAADQRTDDKLKVLQEQHDKQIKGKDLQIQTLQDKLAAGQEQHVKELTDKDLVIKELETRLPAAEVQTVDKVMELTNENKRLSLKIKKLQEESIGAERLHKDLKEISQRALQKKETLGQEKKKVVSKPTTQLQTELHTELGKLYMELQEAKKPQEALKAQLAAKDMEIEYLMEQHKAKLAAKDSEIQNLKKMIQRGDEMNVNLVAKDGKIEAVMTGGQSEQQFLL